MGLEAGVEKIPQEPLYIGKTVVLTTVIYDRNVPPDHVGMLFLYKVTSYDIDKRKFQLKYQNRMIKDDSSSASIGISVNSC